MKPAEQDFEAFTEGDHWEALASGMAIRINGAPPTNPLSKVRIRFRPNDLPETDARINDRVELSSDNASEIIIDDAAAWEFHCPKQPIAGLKSGDWKFNVELTDSAGVVQTYVSGIQPVLPDV